MEDTPADIHDAAVGTLLPPQLSVGTFTEKGGKPTFSTEMIQLKHFNIFLLINPDFAETN